MLLAPNGKKSNLNEVQHKLVRTPEFISWFGDWINSPEKASKVIDENGEPLVCYHGSREVFNVFKNPYGWHYFYFAESKRYASLFSLNAKRKTLNPYFLNIRNIVDATNFDNTPQTAQDFIDFVGVETNRLITHRKDNKTEKFWQLLRYDDNLFDYFVAEGYDGLVFYEDFEQYSDSAKAFACFYPNQIKLADGTNITFDGSNPDIRFKDGGQIVQKDKGDNYVRLEYTDNNSILGYLDYIWNEELMSPMENGINGELYIDFVKVNEDFRGMGIAKKLIRKAINDAEKLGLEVVTLKRDSGMGCNYGSEYDKYLEGIYSSVGFANSWTVEDAKSDEEKNICAMHYFVSSNPDIRFKEGGSILLLSLIHI